MLTKSLHTITAATNVARHLLATGSNHSDARHLAAAALYILGHSVYAANPADPTFERIAANCAKLLAAAAERSAAPAKLRASGYLVQS